MFSTRFAGLAAARSRDGNRMPLSGVCQHLVTCGREIVQAMQVGGVCPPFPSPIFVAACRVREYDARPRGPALDAATAWFILSIIVLRLRREADTFAPRWERAGCRAPGLMRDYRGSHRKRR